MTLAPLLESILPIYEERATKRQLEGKKIEIFEPPIKNDSINLVPLIGHEVEKGKSRDLLAEKMKVGKNKIQKANTDTNSPLIISKKLVKYLFLQKVRLTGLLSSIHNIAKIVNDR